MTVRYFQNKNDFFRTLDPWLQVWSALSNPTDEVTETTVGSIPVAVYSNKKNTGPVTYTEKDGGVNFSMSVVGVSKENVSVELNGNTVEVKAVEDNHSHSYFFNVNAAKYSIQPQDVKVQCKNGLLVIGFQKKEVNPPQKSNKLLVS